VSRLLVAGVDPLPTAGERVTIGPGLRTWQLVRPLLCAGHEVLLITYRHPAAGPGEEREATLEHGGAACRHLSLPQLAFEDPRRLRAELERFRPDALIGATVYPSSVLCSLGTELPVWGDLFGHPLAEAQMKAAVDGHDRALRVFWGYERRVLDRADRISTVSRRQAWATVGELGLRGRLRRCNVGYEFTAVIPCGVSGPEGAPAEERWSLEPGAPFEILWSGGFNTWTDVITLFEGLEQALGQEPRLRFTATGGALPGHDERTYERFQALVRGSRHRERYRLCGWVSREEYERLLATAHLGLNIDRPCYEALLGSRNRIVEWAAHGLPCATTVICELAEELAAAGLAVGFEAQDPAALAQALVAAANEPARLGRMAAALYHHARMHFTPEATARPLLRWAERPRRSPDQGERAVLEGPVLWNPRAWPSYSRSLRTHLREEGIGSTFRWLLRKLGG
jgi:glycosyltransferase involved in cell wall biosynthesis